MKKIWNKTITLLKNKYIFATLIFIVLMVFFDKNNIITQIKLHGKLNKLKEEKEFYQQGINKNKINIQELRTNPEKLEKYAREQYLMKKDSEDIYLIIDKKKDEK